MMLYTKRRVWGRLLSKKLTRKSRHAFRGSEITNCIFINTPNFNRIINEVVPLGLLSLATMINETHVHSSRVVDLNYVISSNAIRLSNSLEENICNVSDYIIKMRPDFISFYTMSSNHCFALLIAEKVKLLNPNIIVALGGPHASITSVETLKKYPYIDFIGLREGELNIVKIINSIEKNIKLSNCEGIACRNEGNIIVNTCSEQIENLDLLPFIDYNLLNFDIFGQKSVSVEVGRGCPFNCTFCSTNNFWQRKYRVKSAKRIFDEVMYINKTYKVSSFKFEHDLFVMNRDLIFQLSDLLVSSELGISWGCSSRIDTIDEQLLKSMSAAGCDSIYFGIESGSKSIQKKINKNLDLDKLDYVLDIIDKYGICPTFSFIYGFPNETEEDLRQTIDLYIKLHMRYKKQISSMKTIVQLHKLSVLPGTSIFNEHKSYLIKKASARSEAVTDFQIWQHKKLDLMLNDVEIFPQLFDFDSKLVVKTVNIDIYFTYTFRYLAEYLEATYRLLIEHYKSHLDLYYAFAECVDEELSNIPPTINSTIAELVKKNMILMRIFIENSDFKDDNDKIKDIFNFEYDVYQLLHLEMDAEFICHYKHDVISIKRNTPSLREKADMKLKFFSKNGDKRIIIIDHKAL